MDKYEFNIKIEQIKKLMKKKDFATAVKIADTIEWRKVKENQLLIMAADVYEIAGKYDPAREALLLAYERTGLGRQLAYRLCRLSVKRGDFTEAQEFYEEFTENSPRDAGKYILQYEMAKGRGESLDKQISILETFIEEDMDDRWAYELAKLYHKAHLAEKCIELCDTIILWFADGKYVEKALELKQLYVPLSENQRIKYEAQKSRKTDISAQIYARDNEGSVEAENDESSVKAEDKEAAEVSEKEETATEEKTAEEDGVLDRVHEVEIDVNSIHVKDFSENNKYDTMNIQRELAKSVSSMFDDTVEIFKPGTLKSDEDENPEDDQITGQMNLDEVLAMFESGEIHAKEDTVTDAYTDADENNGDIVEFQELEDIEKPEEDTKDSEEATDIEEPEEDMEDSEEVENIEEPEEDMENSEETKNIEEPEENIEEKEFDEMEELAELISKEMEKDIEEQAEEDIVEEGIAEEESAEDEEIEEIIEESTDEEEPEEYEESDSPEEIEETDEKDGKEAESENQENKQEMSSKKQSDIAKRELKNFIARFTGVQGLDKQILKVMQSILKTETEPVKFIFVKGEVKSGKTTLAIDVIKLANKIMQRRDQKIGKIKGIGINDKSIDELLNALDGSDVLVEKVSDVKPEVFAEFIDKIKAEAKPRVVIFEDEKSLADAFLEKVPEGYAEFANMIDIKVNKINDWAKVAADYAKQQGYIIDEMGTLALSAKIDQLRAITLVVHKNHIEQLIDGAIANSNKLTVGNIIAKFKNKTEDGYKVLTEKNFTD